ncbi:MAG: acetyl-CoA carboxylase, carboxyltransferase subunit beta [Bacteroidota bacterium]|nr:acetyl-CoA carboxylase, carboxyltransferase subunit beta [Bacteroidota bacterium]
MAWFKRSKSNIESTVHRRDVPDGSWVKCEHCSEMMHQKQLEAALFTCIHCGASFRVGSGQYLDILLDKGSFKEYDRKMRATDPLEFTDSKAYADRIEATIKKSGISDAMRSGLGKIHGVTVSIAVMDFGFIGGSMGAVVGEKIARAIDRAIKQKCPLIIVSSSGGARMMEGAYSLMQMAKTSSRLTLLHDAGLPYISVLLDPTTGGVTASFAMLGDVIVAEPKALIGFAGPRVIKQTIGRDLPEGFQRAEFLLEKGFLDKVVPRAEMRDTLATLIGHMHNT